MRNAAGEKDDEAIGRQIVLAPQPGALVLIGRDEEPGVDAVVAADTRARRRPAGDIAQIRSHAQGAGTQAAADGHREADERLSGRRLEPSNASPLAPATVVRHRIDAEKGDHRHPAQASGHRGIQRTADHVLRQHDIEAPDVPHQIHKRPHLIGWTPARDRLDFQRCAACGDAIGQAADLELPLRRDHREVADLGESGDEADVGEALAEVEHFHARETPMARRSGDGRSVNT
jgi:hypothetical protein